MNFLPTPNFLNRAVSGGQYNYVVQPTLTKPQRLQTMKIDFNPTPNNLIAVTWSRQADSQTGTMGLATPNANWPLENRTFVTRGNIVSAHYQQIISPSMVNELVLGYNWRNEVETIPDEQIAKITAATVGYKAPQLFPTANPQNLLPNVSWGGIPNTANITLTNIPYSGRISDVRRHRQRDEDLFQSHPEGRHLFQPAGDSQPEAVQPRQPELRHRRQRSARNRLHLRQFAAGRGHFVLAVEPGGIHGLDRHGVRMVRAGQLEGVAAPDTGVGHALHLFAADSHHPSGGHVQPVGIRPCQEGVADHAHAGGRQAHGHRPQDRHDLPGSGHRADRSRQRQFRQRHGPEHRSGRSAGHRGDAAGFAGSAFRLRLGCLRQRPNGGSRRLRHLPERGRDG